jgi:hypothetical protein
LIKAFHFEFPRSSGFSVRILGVELSRDVDRHRGPSVSDRVRDFTRGRFVLLVRRQAAIPCLKLRRSGPVGGIGGTLRRIQFLEDTLRREI